MMRLLLIIVRKERLFIIFLIFLSLAVIYLTPFFWDQNFSATLHPAILSAFNGLNGSPFPLFPYSGFLFAGTCVSWLFLRAVQYEREHLFIRRLMITGILLIVIAYLLDSLPFNTYAVYSFWYTSPNYFWIRLGFLFIMLSALWYIEDFIAMHHDTVAWMPKWIIILGIESFFVYIVHLIILYGWVINPDYNLRNLIYGKLNYLLSLLIFIIFTLVMLYASSGWRFLKRNHPVLMKGIFTWLGFYLVWSLLFSQY